MKKFKKMKKYKKFKKYKKYKKFKKFKKFKMISFSQMNNAFLNSNQIKYLITYNFSHAEIMIFF